MKLKKGRDRFCFGGLVLPWWVNIVDQTRDTARGTNTERQTEKHTRVYKVLHFSPICALLSPHKVKSEWHHHHDVQISHKLQIQYCITSKCYRDRCRQSSKTERVCSPWKWLFVRVVERVQPQLQPSVLFERFCVNLTLILKFLP